jgi:flagellar basal body-associated protein FliL
MSVAMVSILVIFLAMVVTLALAGLVVAFVAFIQQGKDIPRAPRLSEALRRAAERWRVPTEPSHHDDPDGQLQVRQGGLRRPSGH